ncbi:MAG: hypothetical protein BGO98_48940 [Myxococcales bacterium 68-20]|nr:hypothetical protein [Myxococcales bacterium]OJY29753.1 MAG: hypothetical protein BGO98_48940 [Myxococcales bacterium 68-20]
MSKTRSDAIETGKERLARLLAELAKEFPRFRILKKRTSALQKAIHVALALITLGGQRVYLTRYHTVLFGTLWVPDAWDAMTDDDKYILLRHERIHLRQRARMGDVVMSFVYLVPFFPLFLAYGRARIEWEAYIETLRATAEVYGPESAEALRSHIKERFVGPEYGWMWPFPKAIDRWFDEAMADIRAEHDSAI